MAYAKSQSEANVDRSVFLRAEIDALKERMTAIEQRLAMGPTASLDEREVGAVMDKQDTFSVASEPNVAPPKAAPSIPVVSDELVLTEQPIELPSASVPTAFAPIHAQPAVGGAPTETTPPAASARGAPAVVQPAAFLADRLPAVPAIARPAEPAVQQK